jgi:hypothetical protein
LSRLNDEYALATTMLEKYSGLTADELNSLDDA